MSEAENTKLLGMNVEYPTQIKSYSSCIIFMQSSFDSSVRCKMFKGNINFDKIKRFYNFQQTAFHT